MRIAHFALIPAAVLLAAACTPGGAFTPAPPAATPGATAALSLRVEVRLTDAMRMEPTTMSVPVGVPVTFVVTNDGVIDHEFFLGDEAAQAEHEAEMLAMGGMGHDEPTGIAVKPGETKELMHTFSEAVTTLAGCHVVGHYAAGMKAEISVGR
jgi:uncharacterized cupredoxin-like copper-binding protein